MVESIEMRMRAADYYQLPEYEAHDVIELIDGEVVVGMPPIPKHQDVVRDILFLFTGFARKKGGKTYASPIEVYLDEHNVYEPDVLYLREETQCEVGEKRLTGPPDLVVEVLSPRTAKYDRQQKYEAYEKHGVHEYWIVDALHETVEVWVQTDGKFERQGVYTEGDSFTSKVLEETIDIAKIFMK